MDARTTLDGPGGVPCAAYARRERDGRPLADRLTARPGVDDAVVVDAMLCHLSGWGVTIAAGSLADAAVAAGLTQTRHANVLRLAVPDATPARRPSPEGLVLTPLTGIPPGLAAASVAAFPPEHVDHGPQDTEPATQVELERIAAGDVLGPLLPASRLASRGGQPLGAIFVNDRPATGPWITQLFRRPGPEGRGVGSALLDAAIAAVREAGGQTIGLAVTEGNPARALYDSRGFVLFESTKTLLVPGTPRLAVARVLDA